ncbi:MAG: ABC transporter ATP-binding protein [Chloroflexi bacterium]|nr:ABC transporter ATP-binding protein [Chloroflexota bacterium]
MTSVDVNNRVKEKTLSTVSRLSLQQVSKGFKSGNTNLTALENINLEVKPGEFVCLVGPSGCGKSTILNLVSGLEHADSGKVLVNGQAVVAPGPDRLFLFQEPALFPWLNVISNIEFGLKSIGVPKSERRERAMKYLTMVHLQKFADFRVHQLSGGMRQRVAIARALAIDPEVLLMDEPFTALDAQTRDILHQELQQLWAATGKTIIFVTHNVREAVTLGDRVIIFTYRPGRIKREFSTTHLSRPRHIEDQAALSLVREITAELRSEVQLAVAAEYGEAYEDEQIAV